MAWLLTGDPHQALRDLDVQLQSQLHGIVQQIAGQDSLNRRKRDGGDGLQAGGLSDEQRHVVDDGIWQQLLDEDTLHRLVERITHPNRRGVQGTHPAQRGRNHRGAQPPVGRPDAIARGRGNNPHAEECRRHIGHRADRPPDHRQRPLRQPARARAWFRRVK
jgi:hypothetical protein